MPSFSTGDRVLLRDATGWTQYCQQQSRQSLKDGSTKTVWKWVGAAEYPQAYRVLEYGDRGATFAAIDNGHKNNYRIPDEFLVKFSG